MQVTGRVAEDAMSSPLATLTPLQRSAAFTRKLNCTCPIVLAPMASISGTDLSASVMAAGGVGGCGAVTMAPKQIRAWARELRERSAGPYQINLWVPGAPHSHDPKIEEGQRAFLRKWGPQPHCLDSVPLPVYEEQCQAVLEARPTIASSIMGLFKPSFVDQLKSAGIAWWATITTAKEARDAVDAGADAIIVQGLEARGHRGAFDPEEALTHQVGLFALLPHVCDAVSVPVIAAGGIADGRTVAAALTLGASGVQIGTGFLCTDEAKMPDVYRDHLNALKPHNAVLTASFTGRQGRVVNNSFVQASRNIDAPPSLPFPEQFLLTQTMREEAALQQDPWPGPIDLPGLATDA